METLISMTDFVLEQTKRKYYDKEWKLDLIKNYADFLKQLLTLGMFVPVDEKDNAIIEPVEYEYWQSSDEKYNDYMDRYRKAKERVLFEGFEVVKSKIIGQTGELKLKKVGYTQVWAELKSPKDFYMRYPSMMARTVEDLINDYSPISLTETAKKQIGL